MTEATMVRDGDQPGVGDLESEDHWAQLAKKHWPQAVKSRKTKSEVIKKEIWDVLEEEAFHFRSLLMLESLQLLEKYTSRPITSKYTNWRLAIYGLAIPKARQITMCF